jgi:serine/threonine-protein kinase RsbW
VKDEGPGFNYNDLPDPTNPENLEKPNGRGVFLMRNLADNVYFEENGSKVILEFRVMD